MLSVVVASGCSHRSDYQRPPLQLPEGGAEATQAAVLTDNWWEAFNDPALNRLVEGVLNAHPDMAKAALTLRIAASEYELAQGAFRPDVTGSLTSQSSRSLKHADSGKFGGGSSWGLGYEVDLWGKLAAQRDVAEFGLYATWEDRQALRLMLIGKTLASYWQLAYLHQALISSESQLVMLQQQSALVQRRYEVGEVAQQEWLTFQQRVVNYDTVRLDLQQQQARERNVLRRLLGVSHGPLPVEPTVLSTPFAPPAVGLPVTLLSRRPDIKSAEWRLRGQLAKYDQARVSFYPTLSLSANVSTQGKSVGDALKNPVGALGATLALPFLEYEKSRQMTGIAELTYQQEAVTFRQRLYDAILEVEDARDAYQSSQAQVAALRQQWVLARQSERIAHQRYQVGEGRLSSWLDEQGGKRDAELAWLAGSKEQLMRLVALCQALGGGMS
ncbi:TPA: TolC family protein [Aeromonas veronii]|nr:TolC family protein [Aeromonas veronii]HDO1329013.1 TolC family protein [Aeromonas veronii]HDO1333417.1 TolC family protein [Aeromonas veronii]HDO1337410.1 TolC family protein [Aeromonas veronii]HDO1365680.1 TolC family protein [Aeromonas veronii]